MTLRSARARHAARRRGATLSGLLLVVVTALAGCSGTADSPFASEGQEGSQDSTTAEKMVSDAKLRVNVPRKGEVTVDKVVRVKAVNGTLDKVQLRVGKKRLPGKTSSNGTVWTAKDRLEPGTAYRLTGTAVDGAGVARKVKRTFRTVDLTLDQQTYASIAPLDGETVGVGMPAIVQFDIAVTDRAAIERHLSVDTKPSQPGTWHWISDHEVHWRPKSYWKPGTEVTVNADINGVDAGNGIYGQEDRTSSFTVGDALVMKVDVAAHTMRVERNGELLRTMPISAGKPGFTTRSGVKVIMEKHRYKDMDAATTGISEDDPEYYDMENVEYAMRVTYSGEFLHAAPWSVGSQGSANVSHGCVGMSTSDAGWLYSIAKRGDVVDVTGSDRSMELANGYGDWNLSWPEYKAGSALS